MSDASCCDPREFSALSKKEIGKIKKLKIKGCSAAVIPICCSGSSKSKPKKPKK
ncbi:MAG: hypothetical protein OEV55_00775 [candidate division Zixibacteria bacterium]|nr:hypothetical protein [candidate division Zixibacteria bacterium]